jgi:hypothetical protein
VSEGNCKEIELPASGPPTFHLTKLRPNTFYKVELRARNVIGYSLPGQVIFKTARGESRAFLSLILVHFFLFTKN